MPFPRSFAHLKREISEKKWQEAKMWANSRAAGKKYQYWRGKMCQKPGLSSGEEQQAAGGEILPVEARSLPQLVSASSGVDGNWLCDLDRSHASNE